ncbi:MAG: hypothetical protein D6758_00930 [Gammaproteobacteria bacterium]|nr:MAG: hypothetical protein D6758_00930 [Gammaproteobacteria bacterium]
MRTVWFGLVLSSLLLLAPAWSRGQCMLPPGAVAEAEGWLIPEAIAREVFRRYKAEGQYEGTFGMFVNELIDNHLIQIYSGHALQKRMEEVDRDSAVGFATEVNLRRQRTGLLSALYPEALSAWMHRQYPDGIDGALTRALPADWSRHLRAARPSLEARLSLETVDWARSVIVAELALPDGKTSALSLFQAWVDQNIQGRLALLQGDEVLLRHYTERWALERVIDFWGKQTLPKADYAFVAVMVSDRHVAQRYRNQLGLNLGLHDDNPALQAAAGKVKPEAIRDWYAQHADQFDIIQRVRAQWRMAGQPEGLAGEKAERGSGWLARKDGWLAMLAFAQTGTDWSRPVRQPDGRWVQVRVTERATKRLDWQDETVRYEASRAIAWNYLRSTYLAQLEGWRAKARICRASLKVAG